MMNESFLLYHEPVFRPPAEADSVIVQVTLGCKWNQCRFCEMYSTKKFAVKSFETLKKEVTLLAGLHPETARVFLGDGDIFSADKDFVVKTLQLIKKSFPNLKRISAYASSREMGKYTAEELTEIKKAGLSLLYVGIESGDDEVLFLVKKGVTALQQINTLKQARQIGFKLSVMILNGLGGKKYSTQHAINSALLLNEIQPELLSLLVISFPMGQDHFRSRLDEDFHPLSQLETLKEMRLLIQYLELNQTVFRSDHASNYLVFRGGLNRDKERFLDQLDHIIENTVHIPRTHLRQQASLL